MAKSLINFSLKIRKKYEKKNKRYNSSGVFTLDTKIEVWEPCQRFLQKIQNGSKLLKKNSSRKLFVWTRRGQFWQLLEVFLAKSLKIFRSKLEKVLKKCLKNCFFRKVYSGHVDRILRTMPKVSAEKPKRFKTFESFFMPKIVRLHTQKLVLTTPWSFLAKSLKNFRSKIEKNSEKKNKKNHFLRNFYSEHVDRILRTMPNVSAENPKRFKILKKKSSHILFLWTRRR